MGACCDVLHSVSDGALCAGVLASDVLDQECVVLLVLLIRRARKPTRFSWASPTLPSWPTFPELEVFVMLSDPQGWSWSAGGSRRGGGHIAAAAAAAHRAPLLLLLLLLQSHVMTFQRSLLRPVMSIVFGLDHLDQGRVRLFSLCQRLHAANCLSLQ